jgi:hypothetical protein
MNPISYLSIFDFIVNNASTIIILILTGVFAILIAEILLASWKKPKFVFQVSNVKQGKIGFAVYIRKKQVKEATVTCNGVKYEWEKEDGAKSESLDLRIGDPCVFFYPFGVRAEFIEDLTKIRVLSYVSSHIELYQGGLALLITEPVTGKIIHNIGYAIPAHSKSLVVFAPWDIQDAFNVRIRIVGEGIEEESEYILRVGLRYLIIQPIIDGKPLMQYVNWAFEIKNTSKYFYRRQKERFIF